MRTVVCVLLLLSLAGVPSATLMSRSASDAVGRDSALSHQAQPPLVHAQPVNRLPSLRDVTLRDASCDLGNRESARLIAGLSCVGGATAMATRPRPTLRI
jgi:hypothetical protein